MIKRFELNEDDAKKLGDYIETLRIKNNFGFNQLAIKSDVNVRSLNEIINGKSKRTNPFHLQKIAKALRIDYKELYKIIGYLHESDFKEASELRIKLEEFEKKLSEFTSNLYISENTGIIGNNNSNIHIGNKTGIENENLDISDLNEKKLKQLKSYIKFLKSEE